MPYRRLGATFALALALLGCQPDGQRPAVSLDHARQITAQFQGQGFQPPPRTISDIAAILDQQRPDPARVAALITRADAQPATGLSDAARAAFYFDRGTAAAELGRANQRVTDLAAAFDFAVAARLAPSVLNTYVQQAGFAHSAIGNRREALDLAKQRVAMAPTPGGRLTALAFEVQVLLAMGDIDAARSALTRTEAALREAQSRAGSGTPQGFVWHWETQYHRTRALFLLETGRAPEALSALEDALARNLRTVGVQDQLTALTGEPRGVYSQLTDTIRTERARTLAKLNRLVEGEAEIRTALLARLTRSGRYSSDTVGSTLDLADLLIEQGRARESERLSKVAVETLSTMRVADDAGIALRALRIAGRAQVALDDYSSAADTFAALRARTESNPQARVAIFDRNPNWAAVALRTGQAPEAERVMTGIVARNVEILGERHWDTAMSRGMLGAAKLAQGDIPGALAAFDAAVPILLQSSRQSDDEEAGSVARDRQLKMVFEAAMGALARSGRADAVEQAFRLADAVRGAGVQRALAQSSARAAASDPALAELVRQEQDTQKQVGALQGLLTNVLASAERDEAAVRALRTQIDSLRSARAALRGEIERRFPSYAQLIDPRPATIEETRRSLRPGEALIATYVGRERSFVWAVPQSGAVAFASVDKGQRAIAEAVANLRKALDPNAATLGDIPAFDVALANSLYNDLLKPVEAGFANADSLLVVPHDALGQLPFGVLVTQAAPLRAERPGEALFANYKDVPFLIRKAAITQLPSVAALSTLRGLPVPPANRRAFVGFGDPWFSPQQAQEARAEATQTAQLQTRGAALQTRGLPLVRRNAPATQSVDSAELAMLPRLPDTADEVKGIALALNADASDVILGAQANERNVKSMDLSNRRVVMFATHGLIPGDLNGLTQPALALSAPNVADVDGDGLLTLDEVLGLKLNADWVVLSACNTATGDGAGAEAVSGLGRAFFYAGTRALLVSNWPVETTSARALTTDLFARQARDPALARAQALRQAMAGLIDGSGYVDPASRATVFAYAHPIFWAPFSLVGDGGGNARQVSEAR